MLPEIVAHFVVDVHARGNFLPADFERDPNLENLKWKFQWWWSPHVLGDCIIQSYYIPLENWLSRDMKIHQILYNIMIYFNKVILRSRKVIRVTWYFHAIITHRLWLIILVDHLCPWNRLHFIPLHFELFLLSFESSEWKWGKKLHTYTLSFSRSLIFLSLSVSFFNYLIFTTPLILPSRIRSLLLYKLQTRNQKG